MKDSSSNQAPNHPMDSLLVIKVKFGDTIRRFTAYVDENTLHDLDMAKLKNKIHTLFNLPDKADLTLTYTDEDKDDITLVDDNDLIDATAQKLNPLRITVHTNRERRPVRLVSTSSARVVRIPTRTDSVDPQGMKCDLEIPNLEICRDAFHGLQKRDADVMATKFMKNLSKMESRTVEYSEIPHHKMFPKRSDDLGKKLVEALLKRTENSDNVKWSTANESSKYTTNLPHHSLGCPILKSPPKLSPNKRGFFALNGNKSKKNSGELCLFNRDHVNNGRACHKGIQCVGCWVHPIMGTRFKSKVKEDYDLCSICFAHRGDEADYIRIDVPVSVKFPGFSKNFDDVDASLDRPRAVEAPHTCANGTEAINNYTLPETVNPNSAIDKGKRKNELPEFSLHNGSSIPDGVSVPVTPVVPTHVSNPVFESSFVQLEPSTGIDASSMEVDLEYELMLLDALEEMGFKQIDLNKKILRKNEFDLNQSITDLCDMGDWEEILKEIDDMGFHDKETNIKLLKKNEGNIKKVAMSLLSGKTE